MKKNSDINLDCPFCKRPFSKGTFKIKDFTPLIVLTFITLLICLLSFGQHIYNIENEIKLLKGRIITQEIEKAVSQQDINTSFEDINTKIYNLEQYSKQGNYGNSMHINLGE